MPRKPQHNGVAMTAAERKAKERTKRLLIRAELDDDLHEVIGMVRGGLGYAEATHIVNRLVAVRIRLHEL